MLSIAAAVSGAPRTLYSADVSDREVSSDSSPNVDVCDLPGGSDMPGTVVHFDATLDDQVISEDLVLPDRGPGVVADVDSIPPPGSSVEICAVATTFDDHEGRGCIVFTSGEVWTGSYTGTLTWDCNVLGQRSGTLDGTFTITVAPDGVATMEVVHTVTGSCGGPDVGTLTTPLTITRTRTQTGFEYPDYFEVTDRVHAHGIR